MAVMKANAYGHGMLPTAGFLYEKGVRAWAVATAEEGIELRKSGISGEILILGYSDVQKAPLLRRFHLSQTVLDRRYAEELNRQRTEVSVHVAVDTGMHRLGLDCEPVEEVEKVLSLPYLKVTGLFSHLCCSDSFAREDADYTKNQIRRFEELLTKLKERNISIPKVHLLSSSGILNYGEVPTDYARAGIALFGEKSSVQDDFKNASELQQAISIKTRVVLTRLLPPGEYVGYGRTFRTERTTKMAVLPMGYADGYPRNLSGSPAYVLIRGQRAKVIGRVCMDQMTVDVTDIPDVEAGEEVVLVGSQGNETIPVETVADWAQTISNEFLSRLGDRLPIRHYYRPLEK